MVRAFAVEEGLSSNPVYPCRKPWVTLCVYNPIAVEGWDRRITGACPQAACLVLVRDPVSREESADRAGHPVSCGSCMNE